MSKEIAVSPQNASLNPMALLEMAIQKGADLDQLQKLMDLQDRWEAKQAKKAYFESLSKFQEMVGPLEKKKTAKMEKEGRHLYSYKYTDLGGITQLLKKPLKVCGLTYRWEFAEKEGNKLSVTCLVSHKDGHTERTTLESIMDNSGGKNLIQQKGSTITYLQRYTLIGALGLSTADEDNDGKDGPKAPAAGTKKAPPPPVKKINSDDEDYLEQWKQVVNGAGTRTALKAIYLKEAAKIDSDPAIKQIFKHRQDQLPEIKTQKLP